MRTLILALALLLVAVPVEAQRGKAPRDRIPAAELAEHGDASLLEVIERTRPHFFMPDQTRVSFGLQTQWRVLVYIGSQARGDTSLLRHYKASEVQDVRYYRPNEANTRFGTDNASVVQLTLKKVRKGD